MLDAIRRQPGIAVATTASDARRIATDEIALVARAKRERAAYGELYDRYLNRVYCYCVARLGSREAAEDATSLIFTKALDALPSCRDDAFRPWLFAIARNVVTDCHRAARPAEPLDAAHDLTDPAPRPDELAEGMDDSRFVHALLAHLPPDQRDVVELRLAGLTGPEIATTLGRGHGAVRIAQYRAFNRLRCLIANADGVEILNGR
ncbi:MAG: RNA polymerase sigma factor [Thermomicrobiales bacterium]